MNSGMENREALREMERLLREDLTPEARKDHEAAREAFECFKFTVEMIGGRHKKRRSSIAAKLAAQDFKAAADVIHQAALDGDAAFFKSLGRALSGKKSNTVGIEQDIAIARLLWRDWRISDKDLAVELESKGFPGGHDRLRQRIKHLRDALSPEWQVRLPKRKRTSKRKKA